MGLQDTGCEVVTTKLFPFELFVMVLQSTISSDFFGESCKRNFSWLHAQHRLLERFAGTLPHVLIPQSENTSKWHSTTRQPNLMMLPILWKVRVLGLKMEWRPNYNCICSKSDPVSILRSPHTYHDINMRKTLT